MSDITVRVPDEAIRAVDPTDEDSDMEIRLSRSQVRRIQRHFCPSRGNGCTCGSGVAIELLYDYADYERPIGGLIIVEAVDID
jgi:hypothetical protein